MIISNIKIRNKRLNIIPNEDSFIKQTNKPLDTNLYLFELLNKSRRIDLHNKFSEVLILDLTLLNNSSWEIVLDEILKFLKNNGLLKIHVRSGYYGSVWGIKSFITDKINIKAMLLSQTILSLNESIIEFRITKKINNSQNWTIGIPTNGDKNKSVVKLMKSVISAQNNLIKKIGKEIKIEFIIVGNNDPLFDSFNIRLLNQKFDQKLPAIGEKKYLIAKYAKYENILFIHDRYKLNDDFFIGFSQWGYDFDYCTIKQKDINGKNYDPILKLENFDRKNTQMYRLKNKFNNNFLYINGGLIILKKSVLKFINFNPNLMHHEAEDIDLARRLHANGIVARYNHLSSAKTFIDVLNSNLKDVPFYTNKINEK